VDLGSGAEGRYVLKGCGSVSSSPWRKTVAPVAKAHDRTSEQVESWSRERSWEAAAERRTQVGA
jgi:hypothetical protein